MTPDGSIPSAAPGSLPPVASDVAFNNPAMAVYGSVYQAAHQEIFVVDEQVARSLAPRWTPPAPPALDRDVVLRREELDKVVAALRARQAVAITGQAAAGQKTVRAAALAVQGMAGVGKTTLAHLLVREVADAYPDGVIWEELPQDFTQPEQAQPVLQRWAGYATDYFEQRANADKRFLLAPAAVRTLLARRPRLLIVLDNVWELGAIAPLRAACPPGAHLVVTTRLAEVAQGLQAGLVEVGLLNDADARALFDLRLGWTPAPDAAPDQWAGELMQTVGNHALGLDVALGVLRRYGATPAVWRPAATKLMADVRSGKFDRLALPGDPGHHVKGVLYVSYERLRDAETQRRFRGLGAFAPEADFTTALAAAVWACDAEAAYETLTDFANAALLDRKEDGWRQHGLLRSFALALLADAGEQEDAAAAHARAYAAAMQIADDAQRYHELLPAMPQLRHAMTWALANDLETALNIAAACLNLQIQFGLVRESAAWADQLIVAARQRTSDSRVAWRVYLHQGSVSRSVATLPGEDRRQRLVEALTAYDDSLNAASPLTSPERHANSQIGRGNILSALATLPGEDRRQRLDAALAAYDDALRFRRPDNAPLDYATTQNNRALLLSALATLPGEDRRQRLYAALAAYDDALRFIRPDNAPLAYATTQNNRANILSELATLPGEDRRQRLDAALAAYDDALRFRRPDNAPLDYATTQNNRALLLSELATLPGEDRRQRLDAALAAYDDALRFRRPDNAPLAYATTQNNRALLLSELATLPGEDRRQRLDAALAAYDDALRFIRPDNAPLDYATTQNNRAILLSELATLPGEDRRQRLDAALAAYDDALRFIRPDNAPLDYATTQNNRALLLSALATLPGEDRRQRLDAALAAYDDALRFIRPDNAPLAYATTQNNRANILSELATLPGEDRRQRLDAALAAYDDALRFRRPDNAPLDYATTQNNRALLLSELATLPGEDRRQRLDAALAAYDDALRFRRPDNAPLDYATTQNNRALLLSALATLPGEDRRQRLDAALAAYDDALRFIRPDNAPLDYATTQNNRANILSELATLPGEDRRQRLDAALRCALEAVTLFAQFQQAQHLEIGQRVARGIRAACGEDFAAIWAELGMGEPPAWLAEEAAPQSGGPALPAELQARLDAAGVHDEASLQAALAADPALRADFEAFLRENQAQFAAMQMSAFLQAFVAVQNSEQMAAFWRSVPAEQEEPFMAAVETWIAQAQTTGDSDAVAHLTPRLEGFRQVRAAAQATTDASGPTIPPELRAKLDAAGVSDDASLQAALEADPELRAEFEAFLQENPELVAAAQMNALLQAFTAVQDSEQMVEFWRRVPDEMEAPFMATVEQMIDRAQHAGDAAAVDHLQSRLDVFRQVRQAAAAGAMPDEERTALAAFVEKVRQYQEKLQSADAETPDAAVWQAITALGEELLAEEMHGWPGMDWAALREQVASDYNTLGNALDSAGDKPAALAAFERAIALQPDFAMWRRNQAGTLIELGRLTDARAAIAAARALEPDAPRLADLEADLVAALGES